MFYCGIDPGLHGAVSFLQNGRFYAVYDMPILTVKRQRGTRSEYDVVGMKNLFMDIPYLTDMPYDVVRRDIHVFIEESQAMPGQGVRSMFTTGLGMGVWLGILATLELPYTRVRPNLWKKALGLGKDKEAARLRAIQLFPTADLQRKKDHGRAEALLLAYYGRRVLRSSL